MTGMLMNNLITIEIIKREISRVFYGSVPYVETRLIEDIAIDLFLKAKEEDLSASIDAFSEKHIQPLVENHESS